MSRILIIPLFILIILPSLVVALETKDGLFHLTIDQLLEVDVTVASKTAEKQITAPSTVSVFTRQQIQSMGISSVEELLNYVPGFYASRRVELGQGYAVSSRGRSTTQASYDILFLIDGQRVNTEWSGGALFYNRFLTTENIKQVEVIRGPGSALYGANAFSGVVNIITVDGLNQVKLGAGDIGQRTMTAHLSQQWSSWSGSAFIHLYEDDGPNYTDLINNNIPKTSDPWKGLDFQAKLKNQQWQFNFRHTERELKEFYQFGRFLNNDINFFESEQSSLSIDYNAIDKEDRKLSIHLDYQHSKRDGLIEVMPAIAVQNLPPTVNTQGRDAFLGGPVAKETDISLQIDSEYQLNQQHRLFAGVGYRRAKLEKLRNNSNYDFNDFINSFILSGPPPTGNFQYLGGLVENSTYGKEGKRNNFSAYIQNKWDINEQLSSTLGIRYDRYSDYGHSTSPRLALIYQANENHIVKLLYGEAFRSPSLRETTVKTTPVVVGNPDIKPEEISTTELAWLYKQESFKTALTLFNSHIEDRIQLIPIVGTDPRNTYINSGSLDTSGIELEFETPEINHFSIRMAYTHLIDSEKSPSKVPENSFSYAINYYKKKWNINFNGYYIDDTESEVNMSASTTTIVKHDDYWLNNLTAKYQITPNTILTGRINNLFDKSFDTPTNTAELIYGVPNRERSFIIEFEYNF